MARKTPTKKQKLRKQYNEQIRRINKNYRTIESKGGSFSSTIEEIIKPVKNPTEATIRRLRSISMDDLYRLSKTETGESGWKLRIRRDETSAFKAKITRHKTQLAKEKYGKYWDTYSEKDKQWAREEAYEEYRSNLYQWKQTVEAEAENYKEPDEDEYPFITDKKPTEPEIIPPEIEEPEPEEPDYNPYTGTGNEYGEAGSDLTEEDDVFEDDYREQLKENITDVLNQNQDTTFMQGIKQAFDNMTKGMNSKELNKWIDEYGEDFSDAIEELVQYTPQYGGTGNGIKTFTDAITMINQGITPLDSYDNPMASGSGGSGMYRSSSDYYHETSRNQNRYETDSNGVWVINRATGEIEQVHEESYISRVNKYGQISYSTRWVDENGMTVDFGGAYIPVNELDEDDDYNR